MKTLFALLIFAGLSFGQQTFTEAGQTAWGDTARWGDADDSASSVLARGNSVFRDSSGTWRDITTDSCSKAVKVDQGGQSPSWLYVVSYDVRTSTGNTDSSLVNLYMDVRTCRDAQRSLNCGDWISTGAKEGYADVTIRDSLVTLATTAGTTWKRKQQFFYPGRGNQMRVCVDGYRAGAQTNDSTFFRKVVVGFQ
jgi:hypothetical protein